MKSLKRHVWYSVGNEIHCERVGDQPSERRIASVFKTTTGGNVRRVQRTPALINSYANLIAAAPELYAAAEEAFSHLESIYGTNHERGEPHVFTMLRAALKKARGE